MRDNSRRLVAAAANVAISAIVVGATVAVVLLVFGYTTH
jgi:hypothetical protein